MVTCIMNSSVKSRILHFLSDEEVSRVFQSLENLWLLHPQEQESVRKAFAQSFSLEMKVMAGFGAAQFLATALMWQKRVVRVN